MSTQDAFLSNSIPDTYRLLAAYLEIEENLRTEIASSRRERTAAIAESNSSPADEDAEPDSESSAIGWVPRLKSVEGIPDGRLGPLHGKLIALGLLKFQLTGRTSGIIYRLSPEGRAEVYRRIEGDSRSERVDQSAA